MPSAKLTCVKATSCKVGDPVKFFSSSANIQQWASPFTAGVSWLSQIKNKVQNKNVNINIHIKTSDKNVK